MAKINRTTVPTLKLYDSMGLLTPYYVDEHSHIATMISNRMQGFRFLYILPYLPL